jgi:hypothetical protein
MERNKRQKNPRRYSRASLLFFTFPKIGGVNGRGVALASN